MEKLLTLLHVRAAAAGLEVSDQVVRLVSFDGRTWQLYAVRLAPGVLTNGKVIDREAFMSALAELKEKAQGRRKGRTMNVVVCLSSAEIFTQTFSLPAVNDKELAQAIALNLKMASPSEGDTSYADWQLLGRDEETAQVKVLAAFVERAVVDGVAGALFDAGFLPMGVESRALVLARMLRKKGAGVDLAKSYLFVNVDNSGLDFLIIRGGALSFEYAEPWRDLTDEKGEIAVARFKETLTANTRQVVNFYHQHWSEPLGAVILSTPTLVDAAEEAIAEAASATPVERLTLVMGQPISPEWLVALGASFRGGRREKEKREINLLGEPSQDRFREEQLLYFLRFWRVALPVALGLLILTFGTADFFLRSTKSGIESRSDFSLGTAQKTEIATLEASAKSFNQSVTLVAAAENAIQPKGAFLDAVAAVAAANHVAVNHIVFQSPTTPATLSGSGLTQNDVVAFEAALRGIPGVSAVNLPLTGIQTSGNTVSFSMTFLYAPPGSPSPASQ
jgi:hypothetical protein